MTPFQPELRPDDEPRSAAPEPPAPVAGRPSANTAATTPTTTTLIAPATVAYPAQIHLEAIVSPVPAPLNGFLPTVSIMLNGEFWRPSSPIDSSGHAELFETLPIGTYEFTAEFGPWGDLEASASAPATVDVIQVPGLSASLPGTRVQSSRGFGGIAATIDNSGPGPENGVAVGPNHIVQVTSAGFRFSDRSGQPMFDVPLPDFFYENYATSDHSRQPRILYDDLHDRWLAVEVAWGAVGHLNVAISTTSDPTGSWWLYDFMPPQGHFPDNPSIGVSGNKVAIGLDDWTSYPEFLGSRLLVISSASMLDGDGSITYEASAPNAGHVSWRPAVGQSSANTLHAVASTPGFASGHILHMTVTGTFAAGLTFTVEDLTAGPLALPGPGEAVIAYAPTSELGDAAGWYLPVGPIAAVWQDGSLWFVSDRSCLPAGATSAQACVRVTELSTGASTGVVQDFVVNSEGRSTYDPGLGITGAGDLILTFTRSSPFTGLLAASPITLLAAVQKAADPPNSLHVAAVIDRADSFSAASYWSSASGIARDPLDPAAIWQNGAVTTSTGWRTWTSRLAIASGNPNGQLAIAGGRAHTNSLRFAVGGSLGGNDGSTQLLLSNSPQVQDGKLELSKAYAVSDEIWWSLANPATGGNATPGPRTIYVQWGDGADTWSPVETATVTVDTPLGASFAPLNPARLLDTRVGNGLGGKFVSGTPRSFQVTGRGGVPANAVAITGNLTVTGQSTSGYVFLGPSATSTPTSSTLNVPLGDTRANGVTVKLSGSGKLGAVYVGRPGSTTHLIFDVTGYFVVADPNGLFGTTWRPIEPLRVLDTRNGFGRLPNGVPERFYVTGFGIPATAQAVTANITVTGQTSAGYLFVGPNNMANPTSSTINVPKGDTRANNATIRIGQYGQLSTTWKGAAGSSTHLIVDVTGYFVPGPSGATYVPLTPVRLLDTRVGTGLSEPFAHGVPQTLALAATGGIPASDTLGITANLTVTGQTSGGYAFVGPNAVADPTSSTINFPKGDTRANGLDVALSGGSSVSAVFRGAINATTELIMDVTGYFR